MMIWAAVVLVINHVLGAACYATIDRDKRLWDWYSKEPKHLSLWQSLVWGVLQLIFMQIWPFILFIYFRDHRHAGREGK
jgi:hypothetical protein